MEEYDPGQTGTVASKTMRQRFRNMFTRKPKRNALYNYNPGAMGGPPPESPPRRRTFRNRILGMFRRTPRHSANRSAINISRSRNNRGRPHNYVGSSPIHEDDSRGRPSRNVTSPTRDPMHGYDPTQGMTSRSPSRNAKLSESSLLLIRKAAKQRKQNIRQILSIPQDEKQSNDEFYTDRIIQILTANSEGSSSEIDNIIDELTSISNTGHDVKKGHWIWWVFPTEKAGISDELKTKVTTKTANRFLNNLKYNYLEHKWEMCIDLTIKALEIQIKTHVEKIPHDDLDRLEHFCKFWNGWGSIKSKVNHVPKWLKILCDRLEKTLDKVNA